MDLPSLISSVLLIATRNPVNSPVEVGSVSVDPIIYRVSGPSQAVVFSGCFPSIVQYPYEAPEAHELYGELQEGVGSMHTSPSFNVPHEALRYDGSGQIIATENTSFHPKWWFSKGNLFISGKPRLVKYYNLARCIQEISNGRTHGSRTFSQATYSQLTNLGVCWDLVPIQNFLTECNF